MMLRFIHLASYLLAILIIAGAAVCLWALAESRKPGVSSEVLMVIPGTTFAMMLLGLLLGACTVVARQYMARGERSAFRMLAALGVALFPVLLLSGF